MSLQITMMKAPGNVPVSKEGQMFDQQGGTIGRGDNNTLVLADPDRFLSSQHCQIHCEAGRYYLIDLSTNGTFVNGSPEPLGKGGKVALANDDMFEVGDYQFKVMLALESSLDTFSGTASPFDDLSASGDPLFGMGSEPGDNHFATGPFGASDNFMGDLSLSPDPELTDPLAALDHALGPQGQPMFDSGLPFGVADRPRSESATFGDSTYSDQADALNQSVAWPESARQNLIPEEWEDELEISPVSPSPRSQAFDTSPAAPAIPEHSQAESSSVLQPEAPRINIDDDLSDLFDTPLGPPSAEPSAEPFVAPFAEQAFTQPVNAPASPVEAAASVPSPPSNPAPPRPAPAAPSVAEQAAGQNRTPASTAESVPAAAGGDRRLVESMGLNVTNLSEEQVAEISSEVGSLMREVVGGMMQVLRSRSSIKNEFRMNVTTIQPVENNPLKFSADVDEAIDNMFVRRSGAYKKPLEAMREGFQEVGEHQVAMIAGIRHGFEQMMNRFDPELLEKHFDKQSKGSMLPAVKKARYWSNYSAHYKGFVDNMENSFQHLFGGDFVQAYEDQLRKMSSARKKNNV